MSPSNRWPMVGFLEACEGAAQLGWHLERTYRPDLGWAYLLTPAEGPRVILYDLNTLHNHLPR